MRFIGITGAIGAGKTEIINYIKANYSCEVYLADEVAHWVKEKGTLGYERIVTLLGDEILDVDGEIHKGKMAEKIFADETLLEQVNHIIHPLVQEFLLDKYRKAKENNCCQYFFVEAALLIEAGYSDLVDEMWYVYADRETRRRRLMENRGYSEEKIRSIFAKQLSEEEFRRACDFVIDNSGTKEDAFRQVDARLCKQKM